MIGKRSKALGLTLLVGFVVLAASGQRPETGPAAANAALDDLAQELAQLLGEPGFRGFLRSEIARSKTRENIVDLETFLSRAAKRPDAPPGLTKLERSARDASATIKSSTRSELEGLDLYLPVDAHRAKWKGGEDFVVAFSPVEDEADVRQIVAYEVRTARRVTLDPNRVPSQIVLVIAAEEHESHVPTRAESGGERTTGPTKRANALRDNAPDRKPDFVGRNPPPPEDEGEAGNSYIGFRRIYIRDVKEPWVRGDPEIYAYYGQREGNSCRTYRRGYSWSALEWVDDERVWFLTWNPAGDTCSSIAPDQNVCFVCVAGLPQRETCWYFSSTPPNSSYNAFRLDIQEYDGGDRRNVNYKLWPGTFLEVSCDYYKRDGDDYVDHGYNYRNAFKYNRDYRQDFGNAIVDFYKVP